MKSNCLMFFILLVNILIYLPASVLAQTDPASIKFKSFTPAPTRTPVPTRTPTMTPIPTRTPTRVPTAIPGVPTAVRIPTSPPGTIPTSIPGTNSACFQSNRGLAADCTVVGKSLQIPKPRYLKDTSLCSGAYMYPYYRSTFVPPDLVDLHALIGRQFWVKNTVVPYNKCMVDDLKRMLSYIESHYRCVTFIGYGYRSYAEQEGLYNTYQNCLKIKPASQCPQAAPPGRSLHQSGIGMDLFCAYMNGSELVLDDIPDDFTNKAGMFNFNRPIPGSDPPHFNGL